MAQYNRPTIALRGAAQLVLIGALLSGCGAADEDRRRVGREAFVDTSYGQENACGVLRVDLLDREAVGAADAAPRQHRTTFRRSPAYQGMEDNDLRGFLDGAFKEGWNQVSQAHLRLGRRSRNPGYGEYELFRNLQRWDDIDLPAGAEVVQASLRVSLESGPPYPVDVAVYAVNKDWNPGAGGVKHDNNSPPAPGEVWWREARFGELAWTVPGAGHAADGDATADTPAQPLAISRYSPEDRHIRFSSAELARYVGERTSRGEPLLFLYKLTDTYEDSIGSVMEIWSANIGIPGSARRPELEIGWQSRQVVTSRDFPILLEAGRYLELAPMPSRPGATIAATWVPGGEADAPASCGQPLWIEYRDAGRDWRALEGTATTDGTSVQLRVTAASHPAALGSDIELAIRDTWIPVGAPEEHEVRWTVQRPDTRQVEIAADYVGDYTWRLQVPADVPGRWTFQWHHALSGEPVDGERHVVDVVAWNLEQVRGALDALSSAIDASGAKPKSHEMLPFELAFMRLERAAVAELASSPKRDSENDEIFTKIKKLRVQLSGQELPLQFVPESIRSREADGQ